MTLRRVYLAFLVWIVVTGANAGAECGPVAVLPAGETLSFPLAYAPGGFSMQIALTRAVQLKASPLAFGLSPSTSKQQTVQDAIVNADAIPPDAMGQEQPVSLFDAPPPPNLMVLHEGKHRSIDLVEGNLLDSNKRPLHLSPYLKKTRESGPALQFRVPAGAFVTAGPNQVILDKGTRIEWSPEVTDPLMMRLTRPARLTIGVDPAKSSHVEVLGTGRVAAGRSIKLRITRADLDFRTLEPTVCFRVEDPQVGSQRLVRTIARFVPDSVIGNSATYELVIPRGLEMVTNRWFSTSYSTPATVQVVAVDKAKTAVLFDANTDMRLTNTRFGLLASLLVIVLTMLVAGVFVGSYRPVKIVTLLLQSPSGKFSLSNLQIFMWTVLVLFSLVYVWISQGQLLALTEGILVLLGISSGTSVLARAFAPASRAGEAASKTALDASAVTGKSLSALIQSEEGRFDLLRFQMLGFTIFTWLYALVNVLQNDSLPEIPETLYWLMGISSSAYLLAKKQSHPGKPDEAPPPVEGVEGNMVAFSPTSEQIKLVQSKLKVPATGSVDDATMEAIKQYERARGAMPTDGKLTKALMDTILSE